MFTAIVKKRSYRTKKRKKTITWYFSVELKRGPDGGRRRIFKSGFATEDEAKKAAGKEISKLMENEDLLPDDATLGQFLHRWLAQEADRKRSRKTAFRYRELIEKYIVPGIGDIPLQKLSPIQIDEFYGDLRERGSLRRTEGTPPKGLGMRSIKHIHTTLHVALAAALKWNLISANPAERGRVEVPKVEHRRVVPPDAPSVQFVLKCLQGTDMYIPAMIASQTGLRRGEVLALRWSDLDLETGEMRVERSLEQVQRVLTFKSTKTGKSRALKMPAGLIEALRAHQVEQQRHREAFGNDYSDGNLVCCAPDGSPTYPDTFSARFSKQMTRLGRASISFHSLRHFNASVLISGGTPITAVSKRLGHARTSMTLDTYAHVMAQDDERAVSVLDGVFGRGDVLKDALRQ